MIRVLLRCFVPDCENVSDKIVRERYSVLAGVLGICCNAFLFALKLTIGILMNSISILSDAFNNLSDMGSSLVMICGAKLSNKKPDREHPFGHGRLEYISSFIVAGLILVVGVELLKSSVKKIIHPEVLRFSGVLVAILALSLLVKLWMFSYNRYMGNRIDSGVLRAASADSLNDAIATGVVILASVIAHLTALPLDGYMGVIVALLILRGGIGIAREVIGDLLGRPPEPELVRQIQAMVLEGEGIVGIHDLLVHDYGPGRVFASAHAEVPDDADVVRLHEVIDDAEQRINRQLGITMVIHMDPISVNCERTNEMRQFVLRIVQDINPKYSIHDFRITDGENHINLIFDLVVPVETDADTRLELLASIRQKVRERNPRCACVIQIDNAY